jgi:hypothetical protein
MLRVLGNAVDRTDFYTLSFFIPPYAFGATFPFDHKNIIPF